MATTIQKPAAWVTLLTKNSYLAGALVLHASLVAHKSAYPLVVFATETFPQSGRDVLKARGVTVRDIKYLEPEGQNKKDYSDGHDHRFVDTWTKLRCFELIEFERVVMLDSDMLVTANMDELMTLPLEKGWVAASHVCACNPRKLPHYPADWIPANCAHTLAKGVTPISPSEFTKPTHHLLNSGLVILRPSLETFESIKHTLHTDPIVSSFTFPDQDLLAYEFKGRFLSLGYIYNALKTLRYCHADLWRDEDVKNVHYIIDKPWDCRVADMKEDDPNKVTHGWWWDAYERMMNTWGDVAGKELVESLVANPKSA
ncbi:glycosyltransferase family 8 protein [Pseudohyphozyma bogoriensis]|nr:glycosyltransferase family 8 protein [Pseudohyphozyma bogoriensis]